MAVSPAVPIIIACRVLSVEGSLTSQSPFTRARSANPPDQPSPTPHPVRTTRSPGRRASDVDRSTVPAKSIPGMIG
jgi:hypothetical protein